MKELPKNKRRIKQHKGEAYGSCEDLRTDPQYRHLVHKTRKEVLEKQVESEFDSEIKDFIKYGNNYP